MLGERLKEVLGGGRLKDGVGGGESTRLTAVRTRAPYVTLDLQ